MSSLIDMALDDIIKQKPRGGRRGGSAASRFRKNDNQNQSQRSSRGGFKSSRGGAKSQEFKRKRSFVQVTQTQRDETSNSDGVWKHDMFEQIQQEEQNQNFQRRSTNNNNFSTNSTGSGRKVLVENLEFSVSEQSLKELFERVGTVRRVGINYDRSGRSLGKGFAIFDTAEGANAAVKAYNGVELDGKPIKLTFPNAGEPKVV